MAYRYTDDDSTLKRWIEDRIKHLDDDEYEDDTSADVSLHEIALFVWVLSLCLCGCICCCCALCCARSMWLIGAQAVLLGLVILNWNFENFPIMLLIFTALTLYLLIQTVQRMNDQDESRVNISHIILAYIVSIVYFVHEKWLSYHELIIVLKKNIV